MYHYRIYGEHLKAPIIFPQLIAEPIKDQKEDITIEKGSIAERITKETTKQNWSISKDRSVIHNRTAWIEITNGNTITYELKPQAKEQYLRSYILGPALAMLFTQQRKLPVHCSVICRDEKAIMIAGESGCGKSTLTSALLEDGFQFVADDMIILNRENDLKTVAYPAFPYQKLCRDAALKAGYLLENLIYIDEDKDKFLVPRLECYPGKTVPVKEMIVLMCNNQNSVTVKEISGIDKVSLLYHNLFLRNFFAYEEVQKELFNQCLFMAQDINMHIIIRPKEGDSIKEIVKIVKQIV